MSKRCPFVWALLGALSICYLANSAFAQASDAPSLDYSARPVLSPAGALQAIEITTSFPADPDGKTDVGLPDQWGRGQAFYKHLGPVEVEGGVLAGSDEPASLTILSRPNVRLTMRYRVLAYLKAGQEADIDADFSQPIVGPDFFYVFGPQVFAWIGGREDEPVSFTWHGQQDWTFASDLEHSTGASLTLKTLFNSVMIAGRDVHVVTHREGENVLRVASRGTFGFSDAAFSDHIIRVIGAENAFWGEGPKSFLVTLAPMAAPDGRQAVQGTSRGDAFAMIATPGLPVQPLAFTIAHEYFHTWNLAQLGGYREGRNEIEDRWFSEGFTDYYARKLALKAGVIDRPAFDKLWTEIRERHAHSAVKNVPNSDISAQASQAGFDDLPYDRGSLFAFFLDTQLASRSLDIDKVMKDMRILAQSDPSFGKLSAVERLRTVLSKDFPQIDILLERHILQGLDVPGQ